MEKGYKEKEGKNSLELDWTFIRHLGERMDANKGKYPRYNWKKPMEDPYELLNAAQRHLIALHEGILEDDGREFGHIEGAAANMMMFFAQMVLRNKKPIFSSIEEALERNRDLVFWNGKTDNNKDEIEWSHPKTGYCKPEETFVSIISIHPSKYEHLESGVYKIIYKQGQQELVNIKKNDEGTVIFNYISSTSEEWYNISNYISQIKVFVKIEIK